MQTIYGRLGYGFEDFENRLGFAEPMLADFVLVYAIKPGRYPHTPPECNIVPVLMWVEPLAQPTTGEGRFVPSGETTARASLAFERYLAEREDVLASIHNLINEQEDARACREG